MAEEPYIPALMGLKGQLRGIIPDHALGTLSDHFEVIGNIAVISIPPELLDYKQVIAQDIISRHRNIGTVLSKVAGVSGNKRTAGYEILAGNTTVTLHHEFGFAYRFDLSRVFFNARLATERKRVTDLIVSGERIFVPFCGVGPFAIPAAAKGAQVTAVEQNPDAYIWLEKNIHLNKVEKNIIALQGDAFDTGLLPHRQFDRLIIPTPYGMDMILDILSPLAVKGGMIHFYTFKTRNQIPALVEEYTEKGFDVIGYKRCGNVAPGVSRWVFDLQRD
ncbi:MAG: hypothetical protein WCH85_02275 [Methanomicrobiales archaeon]